MQVACRYSSLVPILTAKDNTPAQKTRFSQDLENAVFALINDFDISNIAHCNKIVQEHLDFLKRPCCNCSSYSADAP